MLPVLRHDSLKKACGRWSRIACFLALSLLVGWEQGRADTEDLFAGFDDLEVIPKESAALQPSFRDLVSGYTKFFTVVNTSRNRAGTGTDWRGLSSLRLESLVETDFHLGPWKAFVSGKGFYDAAFSLNSRSEYSPEVLDEYEWEVELREAYLQGSVAPSLDLKIGRQIVVWGRSDNFRVTDVINPLDNRDPGLVDIEDLRLPLVMMKLDLYSGEWNVDLLTVHEHRYDRNPVFGHFFSPGPSPLPPEEKPSHTLENTELAVELSRNLSGWDFSLYGAHFFNDQANFVPADSVYLEHQRLTMAGRAFSLARGDMLYIGEVAYLTGLRFMNDYGQEYVRIDLLLGIEYGGLPETVISLDYVSRHLRHFTERLRASPEAPLSSDNGIGCRVVRDFMHDALRLEGLVLFHGVRGQRGSLQRIKASYDLLDNWTVIGGIMLFQGRDGAYAETGDVARVFFEMRYDF